MSLIRWEPFTELDQAFNRMLRHSFAGASRMPWMEETGAPARLGWSPSADISETDSEYLIRAELPAVKKEDVKVTVDRGVLTIEGERRQQKDEKTEKYHRVENFYGTFTRSFSIPEDANAEAIHCEDKDGVLTVHIPRSQVKKSAPRQIKVN